MVNIEIVCHFTNDGVPLTSPANVPTIRLRRSDTGALVVTDAAMTELGDGNYRYTFSTGDLLLDYAVRADGDPTASGQTTVQERYAFGSLSGSDDILRQIFLNRAVTTELGGGAKRIDFYADDQTTIVDSITISGDGLIRTNP